MSSSNGIYFYNSNLYRLSVLLLRYFIFSVSNFLELNSLIFLYSIHSGYAADNGRKTCGKVDRNKIAIKENVLPKQCP